MKSKIRQVVLVILCCVLIFFVSGIIAYFTDTLIAINNVKMDKVDISIKEYTLKDGKEKLWNEHIVVVPGEKISKIPRISNDAAECYIRAAISFSKNDETISSLTEKNINGISEDWIKIGNYYYYKNVLKRESSVDLFQSITIPSNWDNQYASKGLSVTIIVDAVQAKNFIPDFQSQYPWGKDIVIEKCIHNNFNENINSAATITGNQTSDTFLFTKNEKKKKGEKN